MDYGMDILVRNFMERISRYSRPKFQAQDLNPNVQYVRISKSAAMMHLPEPFGRLSLDLLSVSSSLPTPPATCTGSLSVQYCR